MMELKKTLAAIATVGMTVGLLTSTSFAEMGAAGEAPKAAGGAAEAEVRRVATEFFKAIGDADSDAAMKYFDGDEAEKKLVKQFVAIPAKSKAMQEAAEAKFGKDANFSAGEMDPKQMVKQIEQAPVTITGATAVIGTMGTSGMTLKKDNDSWKIMSITGDSEVSAILGEMMDAASKVMDSTTTEISDGKYADVAAAKAALQTDMQAAMQPIMPKMMGIMMKKMQAQQGNAGATQPAMPEDNDGGMDNGQ